MKSFSAIASSLALIGVLILFGMQMSNGKKGSGVPAANSAANNSGAKIAYVDIDSLEANYVVLKTKKEEFKKRQQQMEGELERSYQQMQNDYAEVQRKAQNNTLTQAEYESAQKRLTQMQQSLETRKRSLTDQLLKEQDDFNKDLKDNLDNFLEEYNKDKHFDYILSYAGVASSILYADKSLNVTEEVIAGMNEKAKETSATKDTKKENK